MLRRILRPAALVAVTVLASTALVAPATAASREDQAGRWLARQLTDGLVHNDQYNVDDIGLTMDVAFALRAVGGHGDDLTAIKRAVRPEVAGYTTFGEDVYANSVAKAIVFAQATGADPRTYGGTDLVRQLNQRVATGGATEGRIRDKTAGDDYANTIGQSYAAQGLTRARSGKADEVVSFLLRQQCAGGWFRLTFAAPGERQGCDADAGSAPDTDATAIAVMALRDVRETRKVRAAIADASGWLKRSQRSNGSFGGGQMTEAPNSNSTGLAGWALGELGACGRASDAAGWVRKKQVAGDVAGTPLAGEKGAIAYDGTAMSDGRDNGIQDTERDQWRRTSAQAAPALGYLRVASCR